MQAYSGVIEYQKRGLPHAHFLVIIKAADKPRNVEDFDRFVSAEIPDPVEFPQAHATVTHSMMHGPCGAANPNSPCMTAPKHDPAGQRRCNKGYPKDFCAATHLLESTYPVYRRRDDGRTVRVGCAKRCPSMLHRRD